MEKEILRFEQVTGKGRKFRVQNVDFSMKSGYIYGLTGRNGAGKSTTMNIVTGYIGADGGTVKINGYDIFAQPEEAKKCIGYLPEIPPLYVDMTVYEYLKFVAELKKLDSVAYIRFASVYFNVDKPEGFRNLMRDLEATQHNK